MGKNHTFLTKKLCVLSICCLFELCLTIQTTYQRPNLDRFDIYPFTLHNGDPRVTVHASIPGYRCMHYYMGGIDMRGKWVDIKFV